MNIPKDLDLAGHPSSKAWDLHTRKNIREGHAANRLSSEYAYKRGIYVMHTGNSALSGPGPNVLREALAAVRKVGLKVTIEGDDSDILGAKMDQMDDGRVYLSQPHLIDSILCLSLSSIATKGTPAASSKRLRRGTNSSLFDGHFSCTSVIAKFLYLTVTCMNIDIASNQSARFSADTKIEHGKAVNWTGQYLARTKDKGIRSRAGYIITYAGCPVYWQSKLKTEIALSTIEAEYVAASEAIRSVMLRARGFTVFSTTPQRHCNLFADNYVALEILRMPHFRSRTKHMSIKYHFFQSKTDGPNAWIQAQRIISEDSLSDGLTKPVPQPVLERHRMSTMGW